MNTFKSFFLFTTAAMLIASCGSDTATDNGNGTADDTTGEANAKVVKTQNVFYSIPSPIETTTLLKKAGASYDNAYLNDIKNVAKYSSASSKALNLGVYGADLSFTSIFEQAQESMLYLKCASNLANGLGIGDVFGPATIARVETNMKNKDSLLEIISDAYWTADAYLKENERPSTSALVIAGGWIEGLYIATRVAKTTNNDEIMTRIGEQKLSLENLIGMLEATPSEETVVKLLADLKELKVIYDKINFTSEKPETSTDVTTHVTTIGGGSKIAITKEQLGDISNKIEVIRSNIIR